VIFTILKIRNIRLSNYMS